MASSKITIIGLGLVGASVGAGLLRGETPDLTVVGHDKDNDAAQRARKAGAVQRTEWNIHSACEGADLVVLAVPLAEMEELLPHILEELKPTSMVLALSELLRPALELAARLAPNVHFVAGHPVLPGVDVPLQVRGDLFEEGVFCLSPGLHTVPAAVEIASDLVERLGAKPFYVDAQEHDGVIAGVEQTPLLLGALLMAAAAQSPGWSEAQRLAGQRFARITDMEKPDEVFALLRANRANLVSRLDRLSRELEGWRELLLADAAEGEEHPLLTTLRQAAAARLEWEAKVRGKRWDEPGLPATGEQPGGTGALRQMFMGSLFGRSKPKDRKS